jgi:hypothetical protein
MQTSRGALLRALRSSLTAIQAGTNAGANKACDPTSGLDSQHQKISLSFAWASDQLVTCTALAADLAIGSYVGVQQARQQ